MWCGGFVYFLVFVGKLCFGFVGFFDVVIGGWIVGRFCWWCGWFFWLM